MISAHQPAYLGWLGYFHKIALSDQFVILDDVQFEKNSFINRNKIKTSNGPAWLTIPLEMKGHLEKSIVEIQVDNKNSWQKKHWNSIFLNYKKTKYFSTYSDFFENFYLNSNHTSLADFVGASTSYLLSELKIKTPLSLLSQTGIKSKKQELIIDLCKHHDANAFVFGALGKDYVDADLFKSNNISIYFQEYNHPFYEQLWSEFVPYMSIIDALFNLGAIRTREIIFEKNITRKELEKILS